MRPEAHAPVDLVVNCFERTFRAVLSPGWFDRVEADNRRRCAVRTALVNNVEDPAAVQALAAERIADGGLDRVVFVADHRAAALARTGLTDADLEPFPVFSDWALVAATLDGPELMLHWDADVRLREPVDWLGPAVELMDADRRVLVANPDWQSSNVEAFTLERRGPFALGHGFSDQVFLGRRSELGRPIYGQRCLARWRYPFPETFEARVDAHLRHTGRLRAVHRGATYLHPVEMGTSWPRRSFVHRARLAAQHLAIDVLRRTPAVLRPRHLRCL